MKLVYFWVEEFLHIQNQGFNLGSNFLFKHKYYSDSKQLILTRENIRSSTEPDNFFNLNNEGLENITAIVGENGSGKSLILEQLICALSKPEYNRIYRHCWEINRTLIYQEGERFFYEGYAPEGDYERLDKNIKTRCVFYSPIYNFLEHQRPDLLVDVSSDSLLAGDFHDGTRYLTSSFSAVKLHKSKEFLSQILFVEQFRNLIIKIGLYIPKQVKIKILPYPDEEPRHHNFEPKFVSWFRKNWRLKPIQDEEDRQRTPNDGEGDEDHILREIRFLSYDVEIEDYPLKYRWKSYLVFLRHFFHQLVHSAEIDPGGEMLDTLRRNPRDLSGCKLSNEYIANHPVGSDLSFLNGVDGTSASEGFLLTFLQNQTLFQPIVIQLILKIKELILKETDSEFEEIGVVDSFEFFLPTELLKDFISNYYLPFLKQPTYNKGSLFNGHFLEFSWEGCSSGELAYLNLFSRLLNANQTLIDQSEDKDEELPYPDFLYLLIDEGEQGFHLRWQRDYVKNFVEVLPKLFKNVDGSTPKIQLIFSTHSPVSLSDIPGSHVVLIKKEKVEEDGKIDFRCKVFDSGGLLSPTFGANIHDLLKDNFFMDEGFMGRFAEGKIQEIIERLRNEKNLTGKEEKDLKDKINLIGEPVLKQKLLEMLDFKINPEMDEEKLIEQQISDLEDRKRKIQDKKKKAK